MESAQANTTPACRNPECQSTSPGRRIQGYCSRCYTIWRANGRQLRTCSLDPTHLTLLNWAPRTIVRMGIIVCRSCADVRKTAWNFLYDHCTACQLTTTMHAAHGLCQTCYKAASRGRPRLANCSQCHATGQLIKHGRQMLCQTCVRSKIIAIKRTLLQPTPRTHVYRAQRLDPETFRAYAQALQTGEFSQFTHGQRTHLLPILRSEYLDLCRRRPNYTPTNLDSYTRTLHAAIQAGDTLAVDELWQIAWRSRIAKKASAYYLSPSWSSREDLMSCARVGFWQAVTSWQPEQGASLLNFIALIAERRIIDEIKYTNRECRSNNNRTRSLQAPVRAEAQLTLLETIPGSPAPDDTVIARLSCVQADQLITTTPGTLEHQLVHSVLAHPDLSWRAHGQLLGVSEKSIDNALQRIRKRHRHLGHPN